MPDDSAVSQGAITGDTHIHIHSYHMHTIEWIGGTLLIKSTPFRRAVCYNEDCDGEERSLATRSKPEDVRRERKLMRAIRSMNNPDPSGIEYNPWTRKPQHRKHFEEAYWKYVQTYARS